MRVAAILGPAATTQHLQPFRLPGCELAIVPELTGNPGYQAALIFGGDGTVHRHLRSLHQSTVPLLVVPVGSGNDFAREMGITSFARALQAWRQFCAGAAMVRAIDLGLITPLAAAAPTESESLFADPAANGNPEPADGILFCCIAGVGLDSEANRRANRMTPWLRAHGGYALAAVREMITWQPMRLRAQLSGCEPLAAPDPAAAPASRDRAYDAPATMLVFANARTYGDGMCMAPHARVDDGLLDVVLVRQTPRRRLFTFFPTVFSGKHLQLPEVEYLRAARLRITTTPPLDVYADGERICPTPIAVSVLPRALRVIV